MLTIFTIPKPFLGHANIIQRNAIKSWIQLRPRCEIILFGNDQGVAGTVREFGVLHIPEIKKNEFGTPIVNSAFEMAQRTAKNKILVYLNADIILTGDLIGAVNKINNKGPLLFLMGGQRWDLEVKEKIDFDDTNWEKKLREAILKKGKLHPPSGTDYMVFPRWLQHNLPAFAVGRPGWESWLIWRMRSLGIPVIDATQAIAVIHQNHNYSHSIHGKKNKVAGPELAEAVKLAGGFSKMCTLRDADWVLTPKGLKKPPFPRRIFSELSLFYPWRMALALKRKIQAGL